MTFFFARFGFTMLIFAFLASFAQPLHCLFAMGILFFAILCLKLWGASKDFSALVFAAILGIGIIAANLVLFYQPAKALDGMTAKIEGTVTDVSADGGNPVFSVKTESIDIDGAPQRIKIILSGWDENAADPYDKIACEVSFITHGDETFGKILTDRTDSGEIFAYTEEPIEVIGSKRFSLGYLIYSVREEISSAIASRFVQWHAPFMEQILIGTRGNLDPEITFAFRQSGMSHILAISGMHMVVLTGIIEKLMGYRFCDGKRKKLQTAVLVAVVLIYMFVGGFGMSLRRAGTMLLVHYATRFFLYDSHTADNLGIAVAAVLISDPFAACDVGFIMSAVSCLSISVFSPVLKNGIAKVFRFGEKQTVLSFFAEAFSVSFSAFLAVLPISAAAFGEVYPIGIISNIFTAVLVPPIIVLGMLTVAFEFIPFLSFFASGTAAICMIFDGLLLKIAEFFSFGGIFGIDAGSPWILFSILGCAVLVVAPAVISDSLRYVPISLAVSFFVVCAGFFIDSALFSGVAKAGVVPLEHGTAVSCSVGRNSVLAVHGLSSSDAYNSVFYDSYDVFISLEPADDGGELSAAKRTRAKLAVLSEKDAAERFENAVLFNEGSVSFSKDFEVEIVSEGVFSVDAKEISLLYISEECDIIEDIKPRFRRADIVILDNVSPENFSAIGCDYLILRGFYGFYGKSTETLGLDDGSVTFFGHRGNVKKGWLTE